MGHRPFAIKSHADSQGAAVIVPGVTTTNIAVNATLLNELTGAAVRPRHTAIAAIKPLFTGSSFALKTILDIVGTTGLGIDSSVNPGWAYYLALLDDFGDPTAGSVHREYLVKKGVWIPRRLTCAHQGNAVLEWEVYTLQKASNLPIVVSDVAALPTVTIADSKWTLGSIDIGGVVLSDYTNVTIDFGLEVIPDSTQSDVYDKRIGVKNNVPIITIEGHDIKWWAASPIPLNGAALAHANSNVYFRKRTQDGEHYVTDITAEHLKFTMAGIGTIDTVGSDTNSVATTGLRIQAVEDASGNSPLIVDTASAIT